jgi:hypothetical protein
LEDVQEEDEEEEEEEEEKFVLRTTQNLQMRHMKRI